MEKSRKKEIIHLLYQYKKMTGKELSLIMGCSLKTVQNTIKEINDSFQIVDITVNGYSLNTNYYTSEFSIDDNYQSQNIILSTLLFTNDRIDIDELSEDLYLSKATVERKLTNIKAFLLSFDLSLERYKNKIWIEGKEKNKRSLISFLVSQEADNHFDRFKGNEKLLKGLDQNVIKNIVLNILNENNYIIRECCYYGLLENIAICLYRCRNKSHINEPPDISIDVQSDEYKISLAIYKEYSKLWKIDVLENDVLFLASLLKGQISSKNQDNQNNEILIVNDSFCNEIKEIVHYTFNHYGLKFDINEENDFIYNFSMHVKALIQRAKNNNKIQNEMLLSIQKNCPFIYDVAIFIYDRIKDKYQVNINNDEIGYIAVHIGFLIERTNKNCINILLITSSYNNVNKQIKTKLLSEYGDSINIIEDPNKFSKQGIDLIISNQEKNIIGTRSVLISPFFDYNDQQKVRNSIKECVKIKNELFTDVVYATFLSEKLFFRNNNIVTKEDAIKFMVQKLEEQKAVNEDFLDCVIQREELSSTCFFNSFAIPHGLYFEANKSRCCILLSDEGIRWDNSNIHIVILIAVRYHDRHIFMKMYDTIIQALQNEKKLLEIIKAESLIEFIDIIKSDK